MRQTERSFTASDTRTLDLSSLVGGGGLSLAPRDTDNPTIYDIDIADGSETVRLLVESRFGRCPADMEDADVERLSVDRAARKDVLRAAIAGSLIGLNADSWFEGISGSDLARRTPFALDRQGLGKIRRTWQTRRVCVVGDTADDHALSIICDRIFDRASWIPRSLLEDTESEFGMAARLALHSVIWGANGSNLPCAVVSVSEDADYLRSLVPELHAEVGGERIRLPRYAEVLSLEELLASVPGRACTLADTRSFDIPRTVPVLESNNGVILLAPLEPAMPVSVEQGWQGQWYTDVALPNYSIPSRTAIRSAALMQQTGGYAEVAIRASTSGLTFSSERMGFVAAGGSLESRLARPLLHFIGTTDMLIELAAKSGAAAELSPAGLRARNAVELWGSFPELVDDLSGSVRKLLDTFKPPTRKRSGYYGAGYAIRGQGFLDFDDAKTALGTDHAETRSILDRLEQRSVVYRGLILSCEKCLGKAHYALGRIATDGFGCPQCNFRNRLTSKRWAANSAEPTWTYGLSHFANELLDQNGDVPLLATEKLIKGSVDYGWSPEIQLTYPSGDSIELDIVLIVDGRVVVGEAKSNSKLSSGGKTATKAARRLIQAAQDLTADEIILATSTSQWSPNAAQSINAAIEELWRRGQKPTVTLLTGCHGHGSA
jgi:hypothetical protein